MITLEELLEKLEIEEGGHIEYFEQLAELIETPDNPDFDVFFSALSGMVWSFAVYFT